MKSLFKFFLFLIAAFCAVSFISCSDEPTAEQTDDDPLTEVLTDAKPINLSRAQKDISKNTETFANTLFNFTSQSLGENNFVISPLGASVTLSMAANATAGNTQAEILNALNIEEGDINTLNELNKILLKDLPSISTSKLNLHNSFWYNIDEMNNVNPEFSRLLNDCYMADIFGVSKDQFIPKANAWIAEKTDNGITDFLNPTNYSDFDFSFFNVMDFLGSWAAEGKRPTEPMVFHNMNGTEKDLTSIMFDEIFAWSTGYCFIFDLPYNGAYGRYRGYYFRVIFPYEDTTVDECLSTYKEFLADPVNYYSYLDIKDSIYLKVFLPKLALESDVDLIPIIKMMGVDDLFDKDKCDISGMSPDKSGYFNVFKQYTRIELNESGTKAQTITYTGNVTAAMPPLPIPEITKIDRPFAFEIFEASTGVSILQGRINNL